MGTWMAWMVCLAQGIPRIYFLPSISPSLQTFGLTGIRPLGPVGSQMAIANPLCSVAGKVCLHFLSSCSLWAVLELSAASSVYLCAFIFACGSCYHPFCPCFIYSFSFAIILASCGLVPSCSGSFSDTLDVAGKNDAVKCQIKSRWNCMHVCNS